MYIEEEEKGVTHSPRFGLCIVGTEPVRAVEDGVLAERAGFDAVWIPDHFTDVDGDKLEPWTVLSAIAVQTESIYLGSAVTDTQRSHPARTAHAVACLDAISQGRVLVGIGAGEAMNVIPFGLPWESAGGRIARLSEAISVMKLLWQSERANPVSFSGRYYKLEGTFLSQRPHRRPHPPVYVGAMGSTGMLEIVGRQGEGWYAWLNTPEQFRERWQKIEGAAKSAGRRPDRIDSVSHLMIALPRDADERRAAMLGAKATLLMEKKTLRSLGFESEVEVLQYQNLTISEEYVKKIFRAAEEIPDEYVHKTMAIGTVEEVHARVESLTKAGIKHLVIVDHLAPKTTRRTIETLAKFMREYEVPRPGIEEKGSRRKRRHPAAK